MRRPIFIAVFVLSLAAASPAADQTIALRLALGQVVDGAEAVEAVYDNPLPFAGVSWRADFGRRWMVELLADATRVRGELVAPAPDPVGTGVETTLDWIEVGARGGVTHAFGRWRGSLGIGPAYLRLRESNEFASATSSAWGAHVFAGASREIGRWELGGEAAYTFFPNALGAAGTPGFFEQRDLGRITMVLRAGRKF